MTDEEVEAVARAFYESLDGARGWEMEPLRLKERFREQARVAIAALEQHEAETKLKIKPLIVQVPLEAAHHYLMQAQDVSILAGSTFRAVLKGPHHIYEEANKD